MKSVTFLVLAILLAPFSSAHSASRGAGISFSCELFTKDFREKGSLLFNVKMDHPKIGVSHWAAPDLQSFGFEGDGEELAQNAKVEVIDLGVNDIILQLKFVEGEENSTLLVKGVANGTREGSPGGLYPGSNRDIWTSFKVVPVKSLNGAIGGECYYEPGEGEE